MARIDTLGNFLTDVADAIREKSGTSETIQASEFDTAIANIPSGSSTPEFTSVKDLNDYIDSGLSEFQNQMLALPSTYEADTSDEVVLYPPYSTYKYYIIQKKSNGKYRIDWFSTPCIYIEASQLYLLGWGTQATTVSNYEISNQILHSLPSRAQTNSFYYSSDFDTIEDCIQAMKVSNILLYNSTNTGLSYLQYDTTNPIPYSNAVIIDARVSGGDYPLFKSRKISSNETIGTR